MQYYTTITIVRWQNQHRANGAAGNPGRLLIFYPIAQSCIFWTPSTVGRKSSV